MKRLRHPIRAIREPFGTAGLIVACIALIAAVGGTAWAASGLNAKQKKEVTKIAKRYAGKPGAPGAQGPAGPVGPAGSNGKDGAPGTNGTNGEDGKSVVVSNTAAGCGSAGGVTIEVEGSGVTHQLCNGSNGTNGTNGSNGKSVVVGSFEGTNEPAGEPCGGAGGVEVEVENEGSPVYVCNGTNGSGGGGGGEFPATLPTGSTETGVWALRTEGGVTVEPISFEIPLKTAPTPYYMTEKVVEEKFGSEPGELCEGKSGEELEECEKTYQEDKVACPTGHEEPTAAPGAFCLYENSEPSEPVNVMFFLNPNGPGLGTAGAGTTGVGLYVVTAGPDFIGGSWAVTAG